MPFERPERVGKQPGFPISEFFAVTSNFTLLARRTDRMRHNAKERVMRFAILVKASKESEAGVLPSSELLAEMGKFNEQLAKDGILLAGDGLQPSSKGTRLRFDGGRTTVTDGPFAETKELVAGFWIVQGKSKAEVIERFMHAPFDGGQVIEIRQIYEMDDFGENATPEIRERATRTWERVTGE